MNDLRRELAPITKNAWKEIDEEAKQTLTNYLSGRKIVDFKGPLGWDFSSVNKGRIKKAGKAPVNGVETSIRDVLPLIEFKVPFELSIESINNISRGAKDPEFEAVAEASKQLARAEDQIIFYGYPESCIDGIFSGSPHETITKKAKFTDYPGIILEAIEDLRSDGVGGPYAVVLSPDLYNGLAKTVDEGYPVIKHVQRLIEDAPIVWAPALKGALVVSMRGGDFELIVGRDISIGYEDHNKKSVNLYLQESLTFRLLGPEAAIKLTES